MLMPKPFPKAPGPENGAHAAGAPPIAGSGVAAVIWPLMSPVNARPSGVEPVGAGSVLQLQDPFRCSRETLAPPGATPSMDTSTVPCSPPAAIMMVPLSAVNRLPWAGAAVAAEPGGGTPDAYPGVVIDAATVTPLLSIAATPSPAMYIAWRTRMYMVPPRTISKCTSR